jgi:hypothetical protein
LAKENNVKSKEIKQEADRCDHSVTIHVTLSDFEFILLHNKDHG